MKDFDVFFNNEFKHIDKVVDLKHHDDHYWFRLQLEKAFFEGCNFNKEGLFSYFKEGYRMCKIGEVEILEEDLYDLRELYLQQGLKFFELQKKTQNVLDIIDNAKKINSDNYLITLIEDTLNDE